MKTLIYFLQIFWLCFFMLTSAKVICQTNKAAAPKKNTSLAKKNITSKAPVKSSTAKPKNIKSTVLIQKPLADSVATNSSNNKNSLPAAKSSGSLYPQVLRPTPREEQMMQEINLMRTKPFEYAGYIDNYISKNDADAATKDAAKELKALLKKLKPLPPLQADAMMYKDARTFGTTLLKQNSFEHSELPYYENLSLGYENVREAIIDLLLDADTPDRGHRKNLLNEKITSVAIVEVPGKIQDISYCYIQEFK